MDEDADNEASAMTLRKIAETEPVTELPEEPVEPEPIDLDLPELSLENPAFMYTGPECSGKRWEIFPMADGSALNLTFDDLSELGEMNDDIVSVMVPEGWTLTVWEDDFSGAFKTIEGYATEGHDEWTWGCHNLESLEHMVSSVTYEQSS